MKKKIIILLIIVIVIILIIGGYVIVNKQRHDNDSKISNKNTIEEIANLKEPDEIISNNIDDSKKETENNKEDFEEALVNYIINSIKTYTQKGYILKDTTGDVSASKLSVQEFENNRENYKKEIEKMLSDNSVFGTRFTRKGKEYCTYKLENILNNLNLGTHMGAGIGCYDSKGNKIYEYGKTEIEEYPPTNLNVIKYFGYESSELVDTILDEIEKCANNNYILKDTMGDVTAPKLTLTEAQNNRKSYEKTINELISDTDIFQEIYFENNTLNFKCHFEELLNRLGLGTHMGAGINVDEEGIQIFTINKQNDTSSSVSYIILELEDVEAEERKQQGLEYKNKKITNKQKIDSLMKIIDSATSYTEKNFIADFGDCPPCAKIYLSNGEIYTVAAGDQINDNGETVNLMTKWYSEDGSDKTLYKVNIKLGEYIEKLFND